MMIGSIVFNAEKAEIALEPLSSLHRPGCGCAACRPTGGNICKTCIFFAPGQYRIGKCKHPSVLPEGSPRHETESCGSFTGAGELFKSATAPDDPRIAQVIGLCEVVAGADLPWSADAFRRQFLDGQRVLAKRILEILK